MPCFLVSLFSSVSSSKKMMKSPELKMMKSPELKSKIYPNQRFPPKRGEITKKILKGLFSSTSGEFARKPPIEAGGLLIKNPS
ncbi:hypothetical protein M0R45_016957 [Rubus argutus]|uniref:Uncharacterized protein n=1 Tax=Rubus argutus TaxID=59490 RepID=A0AAW1XWL2_RUBAR